MFKSIINFFKQKHWVFTQIEGKTIALVGIGSKNGKVQCVADVREDEQRFIFLSICSVNVPLEKRIEMSELLTRLNFGQFLGNFEMDFEDGEIRYKTSIFYDTLELTPEIIENLIMTSIVTMDTSLTGIIRLISSDITPLQAYNIIEAD